MKARQEEIFDKDGNLSRIVITGDQAPAVPQKGVCGLKTTPHLAS